MNDRGGNRRDPETPMANNPIASSRALSNYEYDEPRVKPCDLLPCLIYMTYDSGPNAGQIRGAEDLGKDEGTKVR